MKAFGRTALLILVGLFLTIALSCSIEIETIRSLDKESYYKKGVGYGIQGKLKEAKVEFEEALRLDSFCTSAKLCLKIFVSNP